MYKEVEINTPLELARYLVSEGDLYIGSSDPKYLISPSLGRDFSLHFSRDGGLYNSLVLSGNTYNIEDSHFYKKLPWYNRIPEGKKVPCYVSPRKSTPDSSDYTALIYSYDAAHSNHFMDSDAANWKYATPIPADELWVPEL